jgi:hypothetical protein
MIAGVPRALFSALVLTFGAGACRMPSLRSPTALRFLAPDLRRATAR